MLLYLALLLFCIVGFVCLLRWMKGSGRRLFNDVAVCASFLVLFFWEYTAFKFCTEQYVEVVIFLLVSLQILILFYEIYSKKYAKFTYFAAKVFFVVMVLEATVFNFPAFYLWTGNYEETALLMSDAEVEGNGTWILNEENDTLTIESGQEVSLYFPVINQPVGTIYVDVEYSEKAFTLEMSVDATDETHQTFREDIISGTIYRFEENSQTVLCHLSGDVGALRIYFSAGEDNSTISISNIRINVPVSFDISVLRVFLLWILPLMAYSLVNLGAFRKSIREERKNLDMLSMGIFLIVAMMAVLCVIPKITAENLLEVFCSDTGDQITQELVDAFEAGSVSLLIEVDESLEEMSNPYDRGLREAEGVTYKWDHVYYNGKYYSYYGIAPVLLFFLPFHLLTGYYFSTKMAVLIFSVVGMWFLLKIYKTIVRKWFDSLPLGLIFGAEVVLMCSCGIYYALSRPKFYELAVACAFMFLTMGVYFLLSSNILGDGRISKFRMVFASAFLGLAVLSRPTMALYCVCACVFFVFGFKKWRSTEHGVISYWLAALLPMALLACVQMAYNYARFGSLLEFGIKYSLTVNDFTNVQFHIIYVLILIYNYLLAPVKISAEYPFISADFSRLGLNGYFFKDNGNTAGLIFMALPIFAYFLTGRAIKKLPRERKGSALALVGLPCVVMPLIAICAAWSSGYSLRYFADFSWEIVMGALIIFFFLYSKCEDTTKKRFAIYFIIFSAICAIIINSVQIYNVCYSEKKYPYMAYELTQLIAFWK